MNIKKIELLSKCIVNRLLGQDVPVVMETFTESSSISQAIDWKNKKLIPHLFTFGCHEDVFSPKNDFASFIHQKFPITKKYNILVFVILHEIGHTFAPWNIQIDSREEYKAVTNREEYREVQSEKFADNWAADYMKKNPTIVKLWDKQIKQALL